MGHAGSSWRLGSSCHAPYLATASKPLAMNRTPHETIAAAWGTMHPTESGRRPRCAMRRTENRHGVRRWGASGVTSGHGYLGRRVGGMCPSSSELSQKE